MKDRSQHDSELFTLRFWVEKLEDDRFEWRGQLRHISSGHVEYFRKWVELVPLILSALRRSGTSSQEAGHDQPDVWDVIQNE